ncbi:MAG: hypothetical protein WBP85_17140 [Terracidiphilus sp.]
MRAAVIWAIKVAVGQTALAIVFLAPLAHAQAPATADPDFQMDFSDPAMSPAQWTLTLRPDGTGHFRSNLEKPGSDKQEIGAPGVDRDIQLSADYAAHVFAVAKSHKWFDESCESHLKVAFQGWKTLSYSGPQGQGSCTFNFSKDRDIEQLGDSLVAVAVTILEGARLELLFAHDRLGLDAEMQFLTEAAADGRAQQIGAIRGILERLEEDDSVLERVRKRARMLLEQSAT